MSYKTAEFCDKWVGQHHSTTFDRFFDNINTEINNALSGRLP